MLEKLASVYPPTAAAKSWQSHGLWSPDMAMGISVSLRDRYDYSRREHGPRPTGTVELSMHARTWGKLSVEDQAEVGATPNAWTDYGDNGFDRGGTTVSVIRQPGEQLTVPEAETIFAPLAEHVIDYFSIMRIQPPRHTPRAGNFSVGPDVEPQPDDAHLAKAIHAATQGISGLLQ